MSFGIWPPTTGGGVTPYGVVIQGSNAAVLGQSSPTWVDSTVRDGVGEYTINTIPGLIPDSFSVTVQGTALATQCYIDVEPDTDTMEVRCTDADGNFIDSEFAINLWPF